MCYGRGVHLRFFVSVPFGDIGSSNKIVKLIRREIKKFPSPSGISVLLIVLRCERYKWRYEFPSPSGISVLLIVDKLVQKKCVNNVSVPFGDIGSSNHHTERMMQGIGMFPSPSGISVLLMLNLLLCVILKRVSVPFGDIGSSN